MGNFEDWKSQQRNKNHNNNQNRQQKNYHNKPKYGNQNRQHHNHKSNVNLSIFDNINYFDNDGNININLFSNYAENIVNKLYSDKSITINQIRKYYEDILNIRDKIESSSDEQLEFKKQLPFLRMMKAKTSYALSNKKINLTFEQFINKNIDYIDSDLNKFKIFVTLFESVVAYSKGKLKDK